MLKALLTTLLISSVLSLPIKAQTFAEAVNMKNQFSLEGVLRDMNLDEPVPFGKVALYQNEKLIYGEDTDIDGRYTFSNIDVGVYQIKASIYGYDFIDITEVVIKDDKQNIADLELKVKEKMYAPVAVVSIKAKKNTCILRCPAIYYTGESLKQEKSKENEITEIDIRSKPGPDKRDPYDTQRTEDLLLYPNPTSGPITIALDFEQLHIELINALGQVLGSIAYNELDNDMVQIDLSAQAAGTYFLSITHDGRTQVEKLIIAHL